MKIKKERSYLEIVKIEIYESRRLAILDYDTVMKKARIDGEKLLRR